MTDWQLGVDVGATRTRAAVAAGAAARPVELDGETWMPSCVFSAEDGELIVGNAARRLAALRPERFEAQPRRLLGLAELYLGDGPVPVTDLLAAVLGQVMQAAVVQQGGKAPHRVVLCYPGRWAARRQAALLDAAVAAAMPHPVLVSEAEVAAQGALEDTETGRYLAVCDLGASRCEASVLIRNEAGFSFAGPPVERDLIGGDDIDRRIVDHLADLLASEHPDQWRALVAPSNARERRASQLLWEQVRVAKEALSSNEACELAIPGIELPVQLTGREVDSLVGDLAKETAEVARLALSRAGIDTDRLERFYLVGGASSMTAVQDALWAELQRRPCLSADPGAAAASGAAMWSGQGRRPRWWSAGGRRPAGSVPRPAAPQAGSREFTPGLVLVIDPLGGHDEVACSSSVRLGPDGGGGQVEIADEPTRALKSEELARQVRARLARRTGLEERSWGPVEGADDGGAWELAYTRRDRPEAGVLWTRCLVAEGRALVATAPAELRPILDSLARRPPPEQGLFETGWGLSYPSRWTLEEKLVLRQLESGREVTAQCRHAPDALSAEAWSKEHLATFSSLPGIEGSPSRVVGRVCGRLDGEIFTFRWREDSRVMRTKLGLAVSGRRGFSVVISLARVDQSLFPSLVRHAQVHPGLANEV